MDNKACNKKVDKPRKSIPSSENDNEDEEAVQFHLCELIKEVKKL